MEQTLIEMDDANIAIGVAPVKRGLHGDVPNQEAVALVEEYPGRFVGFISPDPSRLMSGAEEIQEFAGSPGIGGVVLEPGKWPQPMYLDDRRLYPIYDRCAEMGLPALVMGGGLAGPDLTYSSPVPIGRVATDFPRLNVIVTHAGWPHVGEMLQVALQWQNVYISPDHYVFGLSGWRDYVDAGNGFLQDRFLFGTAYPYIPLGPAVQRFAELFDDSVLHKLLFENARHVLANALDRRPIARLTK